MHPPPLGGARGYVFMSSVRACVRPSVRDAAGDIYGILVYALIYFVNSAAWGKDELIRSCDQKVKGQGPSVTKYAKSNHWDRRAEAYRA